MEKTFEELVEDVKTELLEVMIESVRKGDATTSDTKAYAKQILALFPFTSHEDMFVKLSELSKEYKQVLSVYLKYAEPYFAHKQAQTYTTMLAYMHSGKYDEALALYEGGIIHG